MIDTNPESQLNLFQILSVFIPKEHKRKRVKKTYFKVLNAIFLITQTNIQKGRHDHYPSKEYIAKVAGCSRKEVTEFVTSCDIELFCEVERRYDHVNKRFQSNVYKIKDWVFQWMRLFYRSGMMKHFLTRWDWWVSDFKKRINNWLIPRVQAGETAADIYHGVVNRFSTRKTTKGAAADPLKGADINPTGRNKAYPKGYGSKSNIEPPNDPVFNELFGVVGMLRERLSIRDGDVYNLLRWNSLYDIKIGAKEAALWMERGMKPKSNIAMLKGAMKKAKRERQRNR